jgi:hypothetical protein
MHQIKMGGHFMNCNLNSLLPLLCLLMLLGSFGGNTNQCGCTDNSLFGTNNGCGCGCN